VGPALADGWAGETALSHAGSPLPFLGAELGPILGALALAGTALAALVPGARAAAASLIGVAVLGFASGWLGAPLGPTRFGAPVLAAFAAVVVLAGVAMQALARAVASARVPMARASGAMVVVLELVVPVEEADDGFARAQARAAGAAAAWDDAAWGLLPPGTVVLATSPRVMTRALAARGRGALRPDLTLVPTFLRDARAWTSLAGDAALVPLWRDLELAGVPGEEALSSLATARPVAMAYERPWGKLVGKHLVPVTLFDRFEPEPRGASDRRRALDALAPAGERLARAAGGDPDLAAAAAVLLRARRDLAIDLAADADLVARTTGDLRAFAPGQ
jgi:hypothetical protein